VAAVWQDARAFHSLNLSSFQALIAAPNQVTALWQVAQRRDGARLVDAYRALRSSNDQILSDWRTALALSTSRSSKWQQLIPAKATRIQPWNIATAQFIARNMHFSRASSGYDQKIIHWQQAVKAVGGGAAGPIITQPYVANADLHFVCKCLFPDALHVNLHFGPFACSELASAIPIRKVYFIVNTLTLTRVSDGAPIGVLSASVGTDSGSWCWSFSASIPYSDLEKVEPSIAGAVEVELTINGLQWRFLVEEFDQNRQFGKTDVSIRGRSVTALLEAPYATTRSYSQDLATTSRQLADAELLRPGLPTDFTLDWQLIDALGWPMPANTWSYADQTPVQVLQAIAQGAGGFVNSHPKNRQLLILPEYPAPYWDWQAATVAKVLPHSIVKSQSLRWLEKPGFNGVYVSGENTGVLALVKRTGTAGDVQAPMFINPMISHLSAARNKGLSILSAGGAQAEISLQIAMESSLGLLTPGMLIEVTNGGLGSAAPWRGLVRSTSLSASWSQGLTVTQGITLERHYGGL
jgi:hypothetical protein